MQAYLPWRGIPRPTSIMIQNPGMQPVPFVTGIPQVGATFVTVQGRQVFSGEGMDRMPLTYRRPQEYPIGCTLRITGIERSTTENQVLNEIATCGGQWPYRNCGVVAINVLRRSTEGGIRDGHLQGGMYIRLANKTLAMDFIQPMNGRHFRGRELQVEPAQEFQIQHTSNEGMILGCPRYLHQVWEIGPNW